MNWLNNYKTIVFVYSIVSFSSLDQCFWVKLGILDLEKYAAEYMITIGRGIGIEEDEKWEWWDWESYCELKKVKKLH